MNIDVLEHSKNKATRIFQLDGFPSVLHPANGVIALHHVHEANAKNAPVLAAVFLRYHGKIEKIEMTAIGGSKGERKTDLIAVTLKDAEDWKNDKTAKEIVQQLEERLQGGGTIVITPDMRDTFEISAEDIEQSIRMYRPENVNRHNKDKADDAITVAKDGWDPKEKVLTCALGEACAAGECGEINKIATKKTLTSHLLARYPGIRVKFTEPSV
jgi:hypothetical protein